jgi:hypothetical protein
MDRELGAAEWEQLTTPQRAQYCKLMAEEAQKSATTAPHQVKEAYLRLANEWLPWSGNLRCLPNPRAKLNLFKKAYANRPACSP